MTLDFAAQREGRLSYADLVREVDHAGARRATADLFDALDAVVADATDADVIFQPEDPEANDPGAPPEEVHRAWTLAHVVAHVTASCEESAALGVTLARGVPVEGRSRYEVPWQTLTTGEGVRRRLAESRRICSAFLDAWPDEPHLDLTVTRIQRLGPLNAVGQHLLGALHGDGHLAQLREIVRQAKGARGG